MRTSFRSLLVAVALAGSLIAGSHTFAQETDEPGNFNGFIQSGSCDEPTDDIKLGISTGSNDDAFTPYTIKNATSPEGIYFGTRTVPGFSPLTLLGDERFSMVITNASEEAVACGDIYMPDQDEFIDQGLVLISLSSVNDSGVFGFAILRAPVGSVGNILTTVEVILVSLDDALPDDEATPDA